MRIKQLELIKYGKFSDQPLQLPHSAQDFHVIVGPNEAGKSTVRSAVVELLFGMPNRTPMSFLHDVSELRLGGIIEHTGGQTVFHRARGRSQLRTPDDEKLPDDLVANLLDGTSQEFFEQMFSLDHERLLQGGRSILNASDRLGQVLFESAAGVGSLGSVRESLEERASALWASRRSQSEYALAEARLEEAKRDFKNSQVRTKVWVEARDKLQEVNESIEAVKAEQARLQSLRSKLERVRRLAPYLQELATKQAELEEMGTVTELPGTAYDELVKYRGDVAAAKRVLDERRSDAEARQAEQNALTTDDATLAAAGDIEALETLRGASVNYARDLPIRKSERDSSLRSAFAAAAQLGWPTELEALEQAMPTALALRTVTNQLRGHGALNQAVIGAKEVLEEKTRDLDSLKEQLEQLPESKVPAKLQQAIGQAQELRSSRARETTLSRSVATAERRLSEALLALGQWSKPIQDLRALSLPSSSRVTALQRQEAELESAVEGAASALDEATMSADGLSLQEKQFTAGTKVITKAEVLAERGRRDEAWGSIKSGTVPLAEGAPVVDSTMRLADELVDSQLGTTQDAANLQSLRNQLEVALSDVERKRSALADREGRLNQFRADWAKLAEDAGVKGLLLADVSDWLTKRDAAFDAHERLEADRTELADLRQVVSDATTALSSALSAAGVAHSGADLAAALTLAESFLADAQEAQAKRKGHTEQVLAAERAKDGAHSKLERAEAAYRSWAEAWNAALKAANLANSATTLAEAEAAVDLANAITGNLNAARELQSNRIDAMEGDIRALEEKARGIAEQLAPELLELADSRETARQLTERLVAARESVDAVRRAQAALKEAGAKQADARAALNIIEARIDPLLKSAGVDSIDDALPIAERSSKRRHLAEDIDKARTTIIRDGDGLSPEDLAAEVGEHDIGQVPALLEEVNRELTAANDKRSLAMQSLVTAQQAFNAINGSANAAVAEAKRQEALATMGELAEQYLEVATAARLLKWATDRYRDQKQGPMLKRAGEVFAGLTLGQFSKLGVNSEANPPSLYAKRSNGSLVEVAGLSEGTRDQLFLSLRIAALELQLKHKVALPFIADDLFINFDDERSKAGFEALRDLSRLTQVVFLTHHDHLLPLITEVFGAAVNVVRLDRVTATAAVS